MKTIQPVRGTQDLFAEDFKRFSYVVNQGKVQASRYGFSEISTPILEYKEIFDRSSGQTSDIVSKEMYEIASKTGEGAHNPGVVLRPEGTASVVRAILSNGLAQQMPFKCFYQGPMFRYDRPQKGRLRQFHQIGFEHLGEAQPWADVEILACATYFLKELNVLSDVTLELNSLGDRQSRQNYRNALADYFKKFKTHLSPESQSRLDQNPLRILDSKQKEDQEISKEAPVLDGFLSPDSSAFFSEVQAGLKALGILYRLNPRLVRGLDYYVHTTFEFKTTRLGAQGTILAGGRYDGLMSLLGGPLVPGVGWAAGVERLMMLTPFQPEPESPIGVVAAETSCLWDVVLLGNRLREKGLPIMMLGSGNLSKKLKKAHQSGCPAVLLMGEEEKANGQVAIKNFQTGVQTAVSLAEVYDFLQRSIHKAL